MQASEDPKSLLSLKDKENDQHCLFHVAKLDDETAGNALLTMLLAKGAQADLYDSLSQTALFYAAVKGHAQQLRALLRADPSPNTRDDYYQTPLFYACREGHVEAVRILVEAGAEVNAADRQGHTPLHYAARHGQLEVIKLMIDLGAAVDPQGAYRLTPKKWAEAAGFTAISNYFSHLEAEQRELKSAKTLKRVKATLMKSDLQGNKVPLTTAELAAFEAAYPNIARYWQSEAGLKELGEMDADALLETNRPWETRGKTLIRKIWKIVGAELFHEPVDPIRLNLPDYFDVIKEPMDLGTIKKKLYGNVYRDGEALVRDLKLVFENCKKFNEGDEEVLNMCRHVEESLWSQAEGLGLVKSGQ